MAFAYLLADVGLSGALMLAGAAHLAWQVRSWNMNDPASSLRIFKSNRDFGLLMLLAAAF